MAEWKVLAGWGDFYADNPHAVIPADHVERVVVEWRASVSARKVGTLSAKLQEEVGAAEVLDIVAGTNGRGEFLYGAVRIGSHCAR